MGNALFEPIVQFVSRYTSTCLAAVVVLLLVMSSVGVLTSHVEPDDVDLYSKAEGSVSKVHLFCTRSILVYFTNLHELRYQFLCSTAVYIVLLVNNCIRYNYTPRNHSVEIIVWLAM